MARCSRYESPTGIATVVLEAARHRGLPALTLRGQAPHYLGNTTNPAVSRALLTTVAHLLDLELDVTPFEAAVRVFRTQRDQAIAQDATIQAYV
jgi:proteasome assembly chaperone (PAC2) family protein